MAGKRQIKHSKKAKFNRRNEDSMLASTMVLVLGLNIIFLWNCDAGTRMLMAITVLPTTVGMSIESLRLGIDGRIFLWKITLSLLASMLGFIPGRSESYYDFTEHVVMSACIFLFIYAITSTFIHEKKVVKPITEGTVMIQSIALIYWLLVSDIIDFDFDVFSLLVGIPLLAMVTYTIIHAFTPLKHSSKARLVLSIWSSLLMLVFAIDLTYNTMRFGLEDWLSLEDKLMVIISFVLLGTALMYFVQNLLMLTVYLPEKGSFYGTEHMKRIREMNALHKKRFQSLQIPFIESAFVILVLIIVLYLNNKFSWFPRHTMIWLLFWLAPLTVATRNYLVKKWKNYQASRR